MNLEEWKNYIRHHPYEEGILGMILEDWEKDRAFLQKIIDNNQDAAVLDYNKKAEESTGFRFEDKGYGQHHE